jgi:hypothetical protein
MLDADYDTFERAFRRLCGVYSRKFKTPKEADELIESYYKNLRPFPLDCVLAAGKQWMTTSRKFPFVVDWIDLITATAPGSTGADVRQMTVDEVEDYEAAARARWEGPVCDCAACVGVAANRPLRFVPTHATCDTYERAFNPRKAAVQVVGHWAHGGELAAWYRARAACYASAPRRVRRVLALMVREPGEEG